MIPLKEKSEDTGSSSANSNSTVNLSGPTVLQLDDTDCSYKQQSRPLTPDNGEETFENQHQLQNQLEPEPEHEPEHEPEPEAELAIETETDNTEERWNRLATQLVHSSSWVTFCHGDPNQTQSEA